MRCRDKHDCEGLADNLLQHEARLAAQALFALFVAFMEKIWSVEFAQPTFNVEIPPGDVLPDFAPRPHQLYGPIMKERSDLRPAGGWFAVYDKNMLKACSGPEYMPRVDRQLKWAFVVMSHAVRNMFRRTSS